MIITLISVLRYYSLLKFLDKLSRLMEGGAIIITVTLEVEKPFLFPFLFFYFLFFYFIIIFFFIGCQVRKVTKTN